jgi:hypothetical protein
MYVADDDNDRNDEDSDNIKADNVNCSARNLSMASVFLTESVQVRAFLTLIIGAIDLLDVTLIT